MFVAYKKSDKNVTACRGTEWQCRMTAKGMDLGAYNIWIATITDSEGVVTYPSENFTIVECKDENVSVRLNQLKDYININRNVGESRVYNIKWSDSKVNCEEVLDNDGKSQSPKVYVKSHFKGDDTAKDKRILDEEWKRIRTERTRLLAETDWVVIKARENGGQVPAAWKTYRVALRDIPSEQSSKTKYSEITWPTRPE